MAEGHSSLSSFAQNVFNVWINFVRLVSGMVSEFGIPKTLIKLSLIVHCATKEEKVFEFHRDCYVAALFPDALWACMIGGMAGISWTGGRHQLTKVLQHVACRIYQNTIVLNILYVGRRGYEYGSAKKNKHLTLIQKFYNIVGDDVDVSIHLRRRLY